MPQILCKDCGKPITGRRCTECNGKGEVRNLIFFKKTCEYCKGLGVVYRCPDEFNHYLKRLSPIKEPMQKRLPELGANLKPRVAKAGINTKYVPKCGSSLFFVGGLESWGLTRNSKDTTAMTRSISMPIMLDSLRGFVSGIENRYPEVTHTK